MSNTNSTNKNFADFKNELQNITELYYPSIATDMNDASIGSWLTDIVAGVADDLSYHTDRVYQETNINTAQEAASIFSIARSNGLKIPGPKGAMTEIEISCLLPVNGDNPTSSERTPSWEYAPIIKKGTKVSGVGQVFEVMEDINFAEQFNSSGISNRIIVPKRDSNGLIIEYTIKKLAVVIAGESQIFRKVISSTDIIPFMEITLPSLNVMNVESVIFKKGTNYQTNPSLNEFMSPTETNVVNNIEIKRFFEVDALIDDSVWSDSVNANNEPIKYTYGYLDGDTLIPTNSITKGEWTPLTQKFITEYTDNGYLKIIFGNKVVDNVNIDLASDFAKYQISKLINNDSLGVLPDSDTTMYVLYRTGGGASSNIAKGAINTISFLNIEYGTCITDANDRQIVNNIQNSLQVTNTIPSVSGKDMPSIAELRYMIKYNNSAQNRCVTIKDYYDRIMKLPPKYGTPYRIGVSELNNKISVNLLGLNYLGQLTNELPDILVSNIKAYLKEFRMINDFIEIKSGRIINLSFELDMYIDKNYNTADVVVEIINVLKDYMDINNHSMGDDIFVGDLQRELSQVDGVLNMIDIRVYNEYGTGYSPTQTTQAIVVPSTCESSSSLGGESTTTPQENNRLEIDLDASDAILYTESDTMFEVKYPEKDIKIRVKVR